jgi:Ca-activated chloride channel family protein
MQREDTTAPFTYGFESALGTASAPAPAARRPKRQSATELLQGVGYSGGDGPVVHELAITDLNGFGGRASGESDLRLPDEPSNTEAYAHIRENPFLGVEQNPLSTFSIDVDTASYANVRRFLTDGQLPPPDAVRIEELVNYFRYDYPLPTGGDPFSIDVEVASAPWRPEHRLVRIGLLGQPIEVADRLPSTLVFLLDVSGSMNSPRKLPLVKRAMRLLVDQLDGRDRVSIAVYAGAAGLVLPPTSCGNRPAILEALERLQAGGSTNGGQGIRLAYDTARDHFLEGGINRVILCTDGDFNVGTSSEGELVRLIEEEARSGVFLSVLGFGTGNLKDSTMEKLADRGNGNYAYVDSVREANKVLVEEMGGTLVTIAKDVKVQVELNPAEVAAYRLIGYENRLLAAEDFNDDTVDAGEIGAGHTVTALYEVVPVGVDSDVLEGRDVDPLKYRRPGDTGAASAWGELLTVKLRYKEPDGDTSRLIEMPVVDAGVGFEAASDDLRFAASVAAFGMVLRKSEHSGGASLKDVLRWASLALGPDRGGYRAEFLQLLARALGLVEPRAMLDDLGYTGKSERR